MQHATFFLTDTQYAWLAGTLPSPAARRGRRALGNAELLAGILYVLRTGCRWKDIPPHLCRHGYSSCWRRLRYWQSGGGLHDAWQSALDGLESDGVLDPMVSQLDASLIQSARWRDGTGYSGRHRRYGSSLSLLVDTGGIPLSGLVVPGNRSDYFGAAATVCKLEASRACQPLILNADKGYDSMGFRVFLESRDIVPNIPPRTQAGRFARRDRDLISYEPLVATLRAGVERCFAWLKQYRRLRYRYERTRAMFQAFVDLGCVLICLRKRRVF